MATKPSSWVNVAYLTKPKMLRVEGMVYCHTHTEVHNDTTDPYAEGYPTCYAGEYGVKASDVHRPVYYRGRAGDYDETKEE